MIVTLHSCIRSVRQNRCSSSRCRTRTFGIGGPKMCAEFFGHVDGAMLPAGAADRHRHVDAVVLLRTSAARFRGNGGCRRTSPARRGRLRGIRDDRFVAARQTPQFRHVVRIRQTADVEHEIAIDRDAELESERAEQQRQPGFRFRRNPRADQIDERRCRRDASCRSRDRPGPRCSRAVRAPLRLPGADRLFRSSADGVAAFR